ncbi:MAG: phospholipase D-like domain-containing protein [Capsulimonadaceae bacterium]|nr:phospholipase D-like domain-containing protein [Capsulimonadaceae bacterium]
MKHRGARILENSPTAPLSQSLSELLVGARTVQLAVGYLFIEGLTPLLPALRDLECSSLLIGNVVNRLPEEQIRLEQAARSTADVHGEGDSFARSVREERDRTATLTALNLRRTIDSLPRTTQIDHTVVELSSLIASGRLQVRVYTGGRLHAKVALVSYGETDERAPGLAIVGSSNLTMPADPVDYEANCDLDILLEGKENFRRLTGWFDTYWSAAQDFQKELFEELARRWPDEASPL